MVIRAVQAAAELTPDYEVIVVNDGSADATPADRRRTGAHLSARPRRAPREEPRLRRRAADRFPLGDQGADFLHRRRRAVRPGGARRAVGADDAGRRSGERLQDQPLRSAAPDHHRPPLPPHRQPDVRPDGARRRLRFPPDAPDDFRTHQPREDQRRHLPRDDEEDRGRRLPDRRSAGPSLPPRLRQVAVLQLPPHRQDRRRRPAAVVRARDPPPAPARRTSGRWSRAPTPPTAPIRARRARDARTTASSTAAAR